MTDSGFNEPLSAKQVGVMLGCDARKVRYLVLTKELDAWRNSDLPRAQLRFHRDDVEVYIQARKDETRNEAQRYWELRSRPPPSSG